MKRGESRACRSIVVGTDFSPGARRALARATQIAVHSGAELHVVHAEPRLPRALVRRLGGIDERRVERALADVLAEVRAERVVAQGHKIVGIATDALQRTARQVHADLVVVGSSGKQLRDAVIGSTAERCVASVRAPVLLVRNGAARTYREVIVAMDRDSDIGGSVEAARRVAPGALLSVLHVYDVPYETTLILQGTSKADLRQYRHEVRREAQAAMSELLERGGVDPRLLHLRPGSAMRVLLETPSAALLVVNRTGTAARRMLLGSVTRWVIARGQSDVLLV